MSCWPVPNPSQQSPLTSDISLACVNVYATPGSHLLLRIETSGWLVSVLRREKSDKPERKSPESFLACRASGTAKVAAKKRLEPVSLACQSVPNPLNAGFPLPSPAQYVAIWLYDFDTFSTHLSLCHWLLSWLEATIQRTQRICCSLRKVINALSRRSSLHRRHLSSFCRYQDSEN